LGLIGCRSALACARDARAAGGGAPAGPGPHLSHIDSEGLCTRTWAGARGWAPRTPPADVHTLISVAVA
jgi:hypothetical protein